MSSDPEDPGGSPSAIGVEDEQDLPVDIAALRSVAAVAMRALDVPDDALLDVTLVGNGRMAALNAQALGEDGSTDVLSFPADAVAPSPGPFVLGDVVLCPVVAERQARTHTHGLDDELADLLVHGILHLIGRDHADPEAERSMFAEQRRILELARKERPS